MALLGQLDLLNATCQHFRLFDGSLPILALPQELFDQRLTELVGLAVGVQRERDLRDGYLANFELFLQIRDCFGHPLHSVGFHFECRLERVDVACNFFT